MFIPFWLIRENSLRLKDAELKELRASVEKVIALVSLLTWPLQVCMTAIYLHDRYRVCHKESDVFF